MAFHFALVGNPNSGKTTLFNELTGSFQHVGNWPGVTVEKKDGLLKGTKDITIQDLPGIYSLSPYTLEEVVARDYLLSGEADAIINIIDASNLERNLYLTTQLMELKKPMMVALNMMDVVSKNGDQINVKALSEQLGVEIYEMSAVRGKGTKEMQEALKSLAAQAKTTVKEVVFEEKVEKAIQDLSSFTHFNRFESVKCFERDEKVLEKLNDKQKSQVEVIIKACEENEEDDAKSIITQERYGFVAKICERVLHKNETRNMSMSDKIDGIVTNRFFAIPIFVLVMALVYYIAISTVGTMMTDWVNDVLFGQIIPPTVEKLLSQAGVAEWLSSLVLDGIIGGVGAVLGFLPQMLTLFILLAILEDCGYMARIAFILDRLFRKLGLSGKSFIPMMVGTGCGVPGIMASRTIENEKDRRMTVMLTTFIPCSAKLPIIALIAGALFDGAWWVGASAYFIGMAAIIISGIILKKTRLFAGEPAPFVMELPAYHLPLVKNVLLQTYERLKAFVKKAGTVIFVSSVIIWFLQGFNWSLEMVAANDSILASIGNVFAPIFRPLGFGNWQATVASFTGLVAKENVVSTMGVIFGLEEVAEDGFEIWSRFASMFTTTSAYSFLIFNLLCAPCFAAIGAIRNEMANARWTWIAIGYQCGFAYIVAFIFYQLASLWTGELSFGLMTILAIIVFVAGIYLLVRKNPYHE